MGPMDHTRCTGVVRGIQAFHMDANGWNDIAYNFLICPHGSVYEGRGLNTRSAAQGSNDGNAHYYAICGIWGDADPFQPAAQGSMRDAIGYCRQHGAGAEVQPHKHFFNTACPGQPVVDWINAGLPVNGSPAPAPGPQSGPPWGTISVDGDFGPGTVRALQSSLNSTGANPQLAVDGGFGPASKKALQGRLNATNGPVAIDGDVGQQTVKALQAHVGASPDGSWGAETTSKLQESLNAAAF